MIKNVAALTASLGLAAVVLVGGCANGAQATKETTGTPPAVSETTSTPTVTPSHVDPPAASETTTQPTDDGIAAIGAKEWFTWEDQISVQITKVEPYRPSKYHEPIKRGYKGVVVTVTIRNRSGSAIDLNTAIVNLSSGPNGDQADTIFDSAQNISGFEGSVANNRSKTAKYAFQIPKDHKVIDVEVGSWTRESAYFTGKA